MQRSRFRHLAALAVGLLAACAAPSPAPKPAPVNCCNEPWGYQEPENWAKLSPCYYVCGEGGEQSPINIVNPSRQTLNAIEFA
ncbi:MAG TPA: hypothetical protein VGQ28_01110, partial [Thermoanaerobaculia bacterium]|nr:hypothetical protein [Thermoanaerobaculia bacterium]